MNLSFFDWLIVLFLLVGMFYSVHISKELMKSVTDFLSAGRTAGRYVISVSSGVYFSELISGENRVSQKMILLK
jgi:Na+/proline symporter